MFTSFVGGDAAVFGVRVRFFQRQGLDVPAAISSGAIAGTASWVVKGALFMLCLPFAVGRLPQADLGDEREPREPRLDHPHRHPGRRRRPRRGDPRPPGPAAGHREGPAAPGDDLEGRQGHCGRAPQDRLRPGRILGSQVLIALCLGASLHSVGEHASFATLIVVLTLAAMIGGAVPVPGGAGVIEVGLIAGLTAAGVPQDQAVAAVFIERFCTAYLPPIWGWGALVYMRPQRLRLTHVLEPVESPNAPSSTTMHESRRRPAVRRRADAASRGG